MHWLRRTLPVCLVHRELPERALNAVVAFSADTIHPTPAPASRSRPGQRSATSTEPIASATGRPTGRSCSSNQ